MSWACLNEKRSDGMHFPGHSWEPPHAPLTPFPDFDLIYVRCELLYVMKSRRPPIYVNFAT